MLAYIKHRIGIKAPLEKVYQALTSINGLAGWWTTDTSGSAAMGDNIFFRFTNEQGKALGAIKMEVRLLEENETVHWVCQEGPKEWIGTDIVFDIHEEDGFSIVLFQHCNWKQWVEFTAHCSMKWAVFMLSLKELLETGKGKPAPLDMKIDNWN
ncbi:MAG: SRPBCC domain-containing protein [Chitinophagaceae bacterium]|nr:MAG: SRPBCC domain-containing protein [Chitinophagaceae bacterium]